MTRLLFAVLLLGMAWLPLAGTAQSEPPIEEQFIALLFQGEDELVSSINRITDQWRPEYTPMAIEVMTLGGPASTRLMNLLEQKTGESFGYDTNAWFVWWWQQDQPTLPEYATFKSKLYGLIDGRFKRYFSTGRAATIRLDEIRWGGVYQDGIPPLRQPKMLPAGAADYLDDSNVVFGIEVNGDARAYPKRILAWHEMFLDEVGGVDVAGVYCTLCGAVILYETRHDGELHHMGTSGFLYRSNKLMFDARTQSLWNSTWGEPVVGPLVGKGIRLKRSYVVTTTWGEWKRRHPDTTVLSLNTGHTRDYDEGAAYREYFATDELMFSVAASDDRLQNKDEVLALTFPEHTRATLAIAADYLASRPVYADRLGPVAFVVLTDSSDANRVYASDGVEFQSYDGRTTAMDAEGSQWTLSEAALVTDDGRQLDRLPAHRAFWFGWYAAYPDTRLIK